MHSLYFDALSPDARHDLVIEIHRRQGGDCFICAEPVDLDAGDDQLELDHIDPLDTGGADLPANLAMIHTSCGSVRQVRDLRLARELHRLGRLGDGQRAAPVPASPVVSPPVVSSPVPPAPEPAPPPSQAPEQLQPEPPEATAPSDDRSLGGALGLTVLGAIIPGTGYLAAGRRRLGLATLGIAVALALLVAIPVGALVADGGIAGMAAELASRPTLLQALGIGVLVVAAAWVVVIATGHRMLLPRAASGAQQALGGVLTLVLALIIVVPSVIASRYAFATHDLIEQVFGDGSGPGEAIDRDDPWRDIPRLNLLVLGGDSAAGGGLTTNTMIVISIDTATGETVLIGLPRNLRNAPIAADNPLHAIYPDGYRCGDDRAACLLSGLYNEAAVTHDDLFDGDGDPGLETVRGSVSEITGLEINYHLLVDLEGFEQIVDALGGIDVNVGPDPVPVVDLDSEGNPLPPDASTRYLPPGPQHLDGEEALAFARERRTDTPDDGRLMRQRLVIAAVATQADPVNLLLSYLEVASTASDAIRTDVPAALLPGLVELSEAVRTHELRGLPITDAVIDPASPDFALIRTLVQGALSGPPG